MNKLKTGAEIAQLLEKGIKGDRFAIKGVYQECVRDMISVSYKILNNTQDAEDVFQEAFLKSLKKINTLKNKNSYKSWLKRIVVNDSLQKIKGKFKWNEIDEYEIEEDEEEAWYSEISLDNINAAIQNLPNGSRQIISLYLLEGYKHREIADFLNVSISTSKSQYQYALKSLKKTLTKKYLQ